MIFAKRSLVVATLLMMSFSCSKKDENTMHLTGQVKGLKKGTVYLQKIQDSTVVTLDSMIIDGNSHFDFTTEIEEPEVFYLSVNRFNSINKDNSLHFFGEKGEINIQTSWDFFSAEAKVTGSETHKKLEEYESMIQKFKEKNLELITEQIKASGDSLKTDSLVRISNRNITRSYLYTLNYALANKDSYIAPYIALADAANVRLKYLDTINKSLSPKIANSKYGKALDEYVKLRKELEEKQEDEN